MLAAIKHCFMLWNVKNDLPPACDFQISPTINSKSTWPGPIIIFQMCKKSYVNHSYRESNQGFYYATQIAVTEPTVLADNIL